MSPTEAHKRASKKWDAANMANLAIKIKKEKAAQIKEVCKKCGTTPATVMRIAIIDFMRAHGFPDFDTSDSNKE